MKHLKMELQRKLHYFYLSQTPIYLCRFKLLRKLKQTWQLQLMSCSAQHENLSRDWWTQYKNVMGIRWKTQLNSFSLLFQFCLYNFRAVECWQVKGCRICYKILFCISSTSSRSPAPRGDVTEVCNHHHTFLENNQPTPLFCFWSC